MYAVQCTVYTTLQIIDISSNKLVGIAFNFGTLAKLHTLDLHGNSFLRSLPSITFQAYTGQATAGAGIPRVLNLLQCEIACDCDMWWAMKTTFTVAAEVKAEYCHNRESLKVYKQKTVNCLLKKEVACTKAIEFSMNYCRLGNILIYKYNNIIVAIFYDLSL